MGGELGCWERARKAKAKDKKRPFVTYNLCRFSNPPRRRRNRAGRAKGLNRQEIQPETPALTLFSNQELQISVPCHVPMSPVPSPLRLLGLDDCGGTWKLLTNEIVFKGSRKRYNHCKILGKKKNFWDQLHSTGLALKCFPDLAYTVASIL